MKLFSLIVTMALVMCAHAALAAPADIAAKPSIVAPPLSAAEKDHLAVRDAAIAKIKARIKIANTVDDVTSADDRKALAELDGRLRAIIGPVSLPGFGAAKSNIETLIPELGFGQMDGLVAASADEKSSVIVTTVPLFTNWLRGHKNWWGRKGAAMPQDIAAAVRSEAFYTQATSQGAATVSYGALHVTAPKGTTFASAMLAAHTQDQSPPAPVEMFVTWVKDNRVFIGNTQLEQPVEPDKSCTALRESFGKRAAEVFRKQQHDRSSALENEGDQAMRACVGEKLTAAARAQAEKQAQAFVEVLAGR